MNRTVGIGLCRLVRSARRLWRRAVGVIAAWAGIALAVGAAVRGEEFRFAPLDETSVGLWEGSRPVLVYNHGVRHGPDVPADRARACYVHPLYGPDGEVLTDDFPRDHYHHRGLFWAWPHVRVEGREYDLWALHGIRQQFERWLEQTADSSSAVLAVENGWYVEDRKVLGERVRLRVGTATESGRTIDVELRLTALGQPVTLWGAEGKSYGGLSLRFAPRLDTRITTVQGQAADDLNCAKLAWADLTARFQRSAGQSGIALFVDRGHPGFPTSWITRNYGFLGVGWPGIEPVTLKPNEPVACRYRLWIHRELLEPARLEAAYEAYVEGR